ATQQTETIKSLRVRNYHMKKTKSSIWLALLGAILFLVLLWRRILQMPVERDEEDDSLNRKNRPVS
ncbi:MAG TPA: hypothetical protein PLS83_11125, partial [Methanothrix soehngenii]|nr:hypothetical protein [Methanothrix soehngenii]